jgi:hypothetical protein
MAEKKTNSVLIQLERDLSRASSQAVKLTGSQRHGRSSKGRRLHHAMNASRRKVHVRVRRLTPRGSLPYVIGDEVSLHPLRDGEPRFRLRGCTAGESLSEGEGSNGRAM